jgi:hypothetical protein
MLGVLSYLAVTASFAALFFGCAVDVVSTDKPPLNVATGQWTISLNLVAACIFGAVGAIVSIVLRLSEFESLGERTRTFLVMTGALLPVVGATFALISYAIFSAKILEVLTSGTSLTAADSGLYVAIVIGFVSGFSERFTRGMLDKIGLQVAPAKATNPAA